jgi:sensor histidine kinase YesM
MSDTSSRLHFKITPLKIISLLVANTLIALFIVVMQPGSSFIVSFIYSQCIGISIASFVITTTTFTKTTRPVYQFLFISAAVFLGAITGITIGGIVAGRLAQGAMPVIRPEEQTKFYLYNLLYALLFGAIISYIFISLQKISDEKIKRLEVEKNAVVTEIRLLQSQMEPHFLFNTLSNILGLIDSDPGKAKRMLESFTQFLRASLVTARNETVTLSQEMDVVKNYLDIITVRMRERLKYRIDISADLQGIRIPPLIIQPLVENAVKHGLEPSISGGELVISGTREGSFVRITVSDSGLGINELSPGSGIGLENIKKRLGLVYGGRARLVFEENKPSGLKAVIELPYETDTSHHS